MADTITDNRTVIDLANSFPASLPAWVDLGGAIQTSGDTEIKIEGAASSGEYATTTRNGIFYEFVSDQNFANNHIYIWVNCGVVGLLATKANGGLTFRARGATESDYNEWELAGSDNWPTTVEGGWAMFVIDLESTPTNQNGTPPASSAIRSIGVSFITATVMPRMADNIWVDAIHRLADGTAGVLVQGRNGGATPWTWDDIVTQLGVSVGTVRDGPGGTIVCNTSIQFGANDATTHDFTDKNKTIIWDDQEFVAADLYSLNVIGGSGSQKFELGIKTGSGDAATGSQGCSFEAASAGVRWTIDVDDVNVDFANFYGCKFSHGGDWQMDNINCEMISNLFNDCNTVRQNSALFQRNTIVNSSSGDGNGFLLTDDLDDIKFNAFGFSDGHAIEYDGAATQTDALTGNVFTGYGVGGSTDAALFNTNTSGTLTINVAQGLSPTVRTAPGGTTVVNNNTQITLTGLSANTEVTVLTAGTQTVLFEIEDSSGDVVFSRPAAENVDIFIHHINFLRINDIINFTIPADDATIPVNQIPDNNYVNP